MLPVFHRINMYICVHGEILQSLSLYFFTDVLSVADKKCSGERDCDFVFQFDPEIEKMRPCNTELRVYLEASYTCVKGMVMHIFLLYIPC